MSQPYSYAILSSKKCDYIVRVYNDGMVSYCDGEQFKFAVNPKKLTPIPNIYTDTLSLNFKQLALQRAWQNPKRSEPRKKGGYNESKQQTKKMVGNTQPSSNDKD